MKNLKWWILIIFGLCLIVLLSFWWRSFSEVTRIAEPELVKFGKVEQRSFIETVHFLGRAESSAAVDVMAQKGGRVELVCVPDGKKVVAGEELFTLGGPKLGPETIAVRSSLKAARTKLAAAERSMKLIRDAVNRHLMKQTELATAIASVSGGTKEVAALTSRWSQLNAAVHLKSPIAGIFERQGVNQGQDVRTGTVLARIVPENKVRVVASVFPPGGVELKGAIARIHSAEGIVVQGIVSHVLPERTAAGAQTIWIEGNGISTELVPGTPVTGNLMLQTRSAAAVPETAIARDETGQTIVFVRGKSGVKKRMVKIGIVKGDWVEILSGVNPGEEIAIEGAYELSRRNFSHTFKVAD
ncbi:MAG: efflux RND transporter periplasmic adaptor subunit [Acidobacteria bacterium]|nr:efflux RND transporter periplasmic adaptor subunit [Acidobacteriota bacterium]